jgi:galactokinase
MRVELDLLSIICTSQQVLPTGARVQKLRLWQRVRHVWREAERVQQFRMLLTEDDSPEQLQSLGALMLASHMSCRDDYECSCLELDLIVDTAQQAGAYGARLTGAGWGGCAVVLAAADRVASLRRALEDVALGGRGPVRIFESLASDGAHLFQIIN